MLPVSVALCCRNNERTIEFALRSVAWADEIVVVDSGSTDQTLPLVGRYTDRIVHEPWRGYSEQKRFAASRCRNDWVFVLDSDEEVSAELADEIQALEAGELAEVDVVLMRRRHYVMGRHVRAWGPDWQSRLIHRQRVAWSDHVLHEDRLPSAPGRTKRLRGYLEHKRRGSPGWPDYFSGRRLDERVLAVAEQMHQRGRRCHYWDLLIRPWGAFLKFYILKRGFLEGSFGLMIAQKAALGAQLKYAALWAVQQGVARGETRTEADEPGEPS